MAMDTIEAVASTKRKEGRAVERTWILVGVDGSRGSDAAVDFAVDEARRTGAGLRLVHVMPSEAPLAGRYPMVAPLTPIEARRIGRRILRDAAGRTGNLLDAGRVVTDLLTGGRVATLVHAAHQADLVVLGNERRTGPAGVLDRVITGSVSTGVAARAATPVVTVPEMWHAGADHRPIIVAVKDCDGSLGLVHRAVDIAVERGRTLVLLHAWELPTLYDDMIVARIDATELNRDARAALDALVARATEGRALASMGVDIEIRVEHGQPARVLAEASQEADLLLVARRPHAFPLGHLGATGRAVIREGRCPVEVVPPAAEPAGLNLVLEQDGEIEKGAETAVS